jgi:hypothetical protein
VLRDVLQCVTRRAIPDTREAIGVSSKWLLRNVREAPLKAAAGINDRDRITFRAGRKNIRAGDKGARGNRDEVVGTIVD